MKIVCVFHGIDLDGWMSAAIVKHWFLQNFREPETSEFDNSIRGIKNMIDFIGFNYGDNIPDLSEYDKVIMCDISLPKEMMEILFDKLESNFIWIDHHISAINSMFTEGERSIHPLGLQDIRFAACELTWHYFFKEQSIPEIVRLLGRYDCFGHKGTPEEQKVLEFQYGARECIINYDDAYRYLMNDINGSTVVNVLHHNGSIIYGYLCTDAKQSYKNGFPIIFDVPELAGYPENGGKGYKFICINKERFNPINFGIKYHEDGYDGCACFHRTSDGFWAFSLYNDNGNVDVSTICKQYGGGGHKGAAGFRIKDLKQIFGD